MLAKHFPQLKTIAQNWKMLISTLQSIVLVNIQRSLNNTQISKKELLPVPSTQWKANKW
jgi:hypothetical protein